MHVTKPKQVLSMINRYNWNEFIMVDRPIASTREGFGSALPNHNRQHGQRYFSTEYRNFYGGPTESTEEEKRATQRQREFMAGTNVRPLD